jgi:hypothetical protein
MDRRLSGLVKEPNYHTVIDVILDYDPRSVALVESPAEQAKQLELQL